LAGSWARRGALGRPIQAIQKPETNSPTVSIATHTPRHDRRQQFAVRLRQSRRWSHGAQGHRVCDQDDNFGGLEVGLVQARFEHRKIVRRADGHELSVRLRQGVAFGRDLLGHLLIELLQVLFIELCRGGNPGIYPWGGAATLR
jgi:hypothetical protein